MSEQKTPEPEYGDLRDAYDRASESELAASRDHYAALIADLEPQVTDAKRHLRAIEYIIERNKRDAVTDEEEA